MHIEIETDPHGPLRAIARLPSARVAMLEGLNGIGKSLAVRLLELCVGEMPYRNDSPAWHSLCTGLGAFSITMSELDGAQLVRWEGDSRDWVGAAQPDSGVAFRAMTIDGRAASMDEIKRLVRVHRLAGDEDLVETLSQQADDAADRVRRWARRHADLSAVSDALGDWTLGRFRGLEAAVASAVDQQNEVARSAVELRVRRDALVEARRVQRQLEQLETDLPSIRAELEQVDGQIAELRTGLERTQQELTTLAGHVATAGPVARELRNARRTLERNHGNLAESLDLLARRATEAGVATDVASIDAATVAVQQDLDEWLALRAEYDQAPDMRDLIDSSVISLAHAENSGLGTQVLIEDAETDLQLTVSEARVGMLARREILEGQPPPPEAEELAEAIADAERRLSLLGDVKARAIDAARYRRLVSDNEQRVDAALRSFDPGAVDRLQALEAERRRIEEQVLELATRRATLVQQAGGVDSSATIEQTVADLAQILAELGLDASQIPDELEAVDAALNLATAAQRDAEAHHREARRDLARAEAEVRRTTAVLSSDVWAWLTEALPDQSVPNAEDQIDQQVAAIESARAAIIVSRSPLLSRV
jgi:seryl-tRNA synthetase